MNCTRLFSYWANKGKNHTAIVTVDGKSISFLELAKMAGGMQAQFIASGLKTSDKALVMATPSIELFASTLALLGLGVSVVFVEPWMPLKHIRAVINESRPQLFLTSLIGMAWGMRVKEIRAIKNWLTLASLRRNALDYEFIVEEVDEKLPGIITFTTGTTGNPKGVVRAQGYLMDQHEVLTESLGLKNKACDLTIFPNFVLSNLARGATSLLMPSAWSLKNFRRIDALSKHYQPKTMTAGPAFLLSAMKNAAFSSLDHLHIGGALTDVWIFLEAFKKWPRAQITHVYGSSEAEPVACIDAKIAVEKSKERGFFQTLYLGWGVEEIRLDHQENSLWVSGRHVAPNYLANEEENRRYKRLDKNNILWHDMGDRIVADDEGLWYQGRSGQSVEDFLLEQQLYAELQSSKAFLKRTSKKLFWCGEHFPKMKEIALKHQTIDAVIKTKIIRDRRHRARIDRNKSMPKNLEV